MRKRERLLKKIANLDPAHRIAVAGFFMRHEAEKAAGHEFGEDEPFYVDPNTVDPWIERPGMSNSMASSRYIGGWRAVAVHIHNSARLYSAVAVRHFQT